MNTTPLATIARWNAAAACLALVLWGLPGCGGSDEDHDEAGTSQSSTGEADAHDNDADAHDDDAVLIVDADAHDDDAHDEGGDDANHDDDDDHAAGEHAETVEFTAPQSYTEAVEAIHAQLEEIEHLIETRGLDSVHAKAAVIRDIANGIGRLALKDGSGVPRDAVREINLTAKGLAATFGPIDEAGDSGDLAGTQAIYEEMIALFAVLEKHAQDHDDGGP